MIKLRTPYLKELWHGCCLSPPDIAADPAHIITLLYIKNKCDCVFCFNLTHRGLHASAACIGVTWLTVLEHNGHTQFM